MFNVGNIVWYIDPKAARVKVCKVVEEIIKKTLDGEEKNYVFLLWAGKEWKRVNKSRLSGDFYSAEDDAKQAMLSSAESAIDKMVYKAKEEAQELIMGGQQQKTESVFQPESLFPQLNDPDDRIEVTLDDGTVARVRGL